jgi:hypothetical protein
MKSAEFSKRPDGLFNIWTWMIMDPNYQNNPDEFYQPIWILTEVITPEELTKRMKSF